MKKKVLLVDGYVVIHKLPSKSLLATYLPERYEGVRVGEKSIRFVRGYFRNKLGNLSRKYYKEILPKYTINTGIMYILPRDNVSEFLQEIEKLKEEYREYERQLKEFLLEGKIPEELEEKIEQGRVNIDKDYVELVREYLRKLGAEEEYRRRVQNISIVNRVQITIMPTLLDFDILKDYIDEKSRELVQKEIEKIKEKVLKEAEKKIKENITKIINKLEKYKTKEVTKKTLKSLSKSIEEVEKIANSFGIEIEELRSLREEIKNAIELRETKKIKLDNVVDTLRTIKEVQI